jgi:hypothetical protein
MPQEAGHLNSVPDGESTSERVEKFTLEELDALETLAEFEMEHRRILAMQSLYYRRHKAGGAA